MANIFYIVTCPLYEAANRFKIGIHSGDMKKLIKRYETYHPDCEFKLIYQSNRATEIESNMLKLLEQHRVIKNSSGNQSEWVDLEYDKIIEIFNKYKN